MHEIINDIDREDYGYLEGDPEGLQPNEDNDELNEIDQLGKDFDENLTYVLKKRDPNEHQDEEESQGNLSKFRNDFIIS